MKDKERRKEAKLLGTPIMCLFCKESVLDNYLELHIKYDHKIGHDVAVAQLLAMHFPGRNIETKTNTETERETEFCQENDDKAEMLRPPDPLRPSDEKMHAKKTEKKSHQKVRKDKLKQLDVHTESNCQNTSSEKDVSNDTETEQELVALGDKNLEHGEELLISDKLVNSNKIPPEIEIVGEMVDEITCSPDHALVKPLQSGLSESSPSLVSGSNISDTKVKEVSETPEPGLGGEQIVLSAFGIRFRCSHCEFVNEKVRAVRDHMAEKHGGEIPIVNISPKRQDMRVNIKPPRIHKETFEKALAYYRSFGGLFVKSGISANYKFVRDGVYPIRDLANITDVSPPNKKNDKLQAQDDETSPTRKPGPRRRMGMQSESESESDRKGKYSSKRHQKPSHTKLDLSVADKKISLEFEAPKGSDTEWNVDLFDEIDLDVQNQLLAEADYTGLFDEHASLVFGDSNKAETTDSEADGKSLKKKGKKPKIILDENMSLSKLISPRIKRLPAKMKDGIQEAPSRQRKRSPSSTRLLKRSKSVAATGRIPEIEMSKEKKEITLTRHPSMDETVATLENPSNKLPKPVKRTARERTSSTVVSGSIEGESKELDLEDKVTMNLPIQARRIQRAGS